MAKAIALIKTTAAAICITVAQLKEGLFLMLNINSGKKLLNNLKLWKLLHVLVFLFLLNLTPLITPIANAASIAQAQTTPIMTASIPGIVQTAKVATVMNAPTCNICHIGLSYKQVNSNDGSSFLSDHFLVAGRMNHEFLPVLSANASESTQTFTVTL